MRRMRMLAVCVGVFMCGAAAMGQTVTDVDYSGAGKFVVNPSTSNFDIHIDIRNSSGNSIGSGSDNNIPITGHVAATVGQSGPGGENLERIRLDDMYLQTTRGINMSFPVSIASATVTSGLLTIADNGLSATRPIGTGGAFSVPGYGVNSYGTINWKVSALLIVNESGTINLASYNPASIDINGSCVRVGDDLKLSSDLSMTLTSQQTVPVLGELDIVTTLSGHLDAFAPFQAVPEPTIMLTMLAGTFGVIRRKRS